ncbi:phosphatidate cytidylyltransferase [Bartonella sp. HY329]|uniref:phosphatidate cytidylyltransferase n=1 Tax=unclassified Bartonella TaxID=2645622 RepID=UPI0021C7C487|nr:MULTISPECIES: phosphatidate cytidylyltransferase [unclassified Bartonella]UXM94045.1 phosphatidate cytidylyltransferase [Bartonella sp. HY329]UXN08367.1 phosphatidate cytidylyltransferase [Bartonella sp. HY328]
MSNLQTRIITALILALLTLVVTFLGGIWFSILSFLIGLAVLHEWQTISKAKQNNLTFFLGWIFYFSIFALVLFKFDIFIIFTAVILFSVVLAFAFLKNAGWVAGGFLYGTLPALALTLLRGDEQMGFGAIVFLFAIVWGTDIAAYFNGRALGGPKLAPKFSPNKTWSGAIGGAAIGVAGGVLVVLLLMKNSLVVSITPTDIWVPLLALVLSIASQAGDIGESWVKRYFGVKDSSNLLPGHGGVMDRVDGLVAAAVLLYIIAAIFADPRAPANLFNLL